LASCSNTRYLKSGQVLHNKSIVKIDKKAEIPLDAAMQSELQKLPVPKLNRKWLGFLKINLWMYNHGKPGGKGIRGWMADKVGEPAILLDTANCDRTAARLNAYLFNKGFFHSTADYEIKVKRKRAKVTYTVNPDKRYHVNDVYLLKNSTKSASIINRFLSEKGIKSGDAFDKDAMDKERVDLTEHMRRIGYFDFNKNYIHYQIDSFQRNQKVNIHYQLKYPETDSLHHTYTINKIYINSNFSPGGFDNSPTDTIQVNYNVFYLKQNNRYRPKAIADLVFYQSGKLYDVRDYRNTQNNLISLGVFKFVNISHIPRKGPNGEYLLDVMINMTPGKKWQFSGELEANSRQNAFDDNFIGTALSTFIANKNTFKGGENLSLALSSGVEFDLRRTEKLVNTATFNGKIGLSFPRFLLPFNLKKQQSLYNPKTNFTIANSLVNRIDYYMINATEFTYGYEWKKPKGPQHFLNPLTINFFNVIRTEPAFESDLNGSVRLQKSFEENFIIGANYGLVMTNGKLGDERFYYYRPRVEIAGNLFKLVDNINPDKPLLINGVPYAQYFKIESDFRYYFGIEKDRLVAFRAYAGLAIPHGNSEFLPYVKQFFAGGTNDLRAFRIRGIGPGEFVSDANNNEGAFDRTGDVKLALSMEYRFPIWQYFKGAIFADAGNIWTLAEDPDKPGSQFEFNDFWKEIAIGAGFGVRLDFTYFILRLDTAMPLRRPDLPENDRWVTEEIRLGERDWRRENIILNLGIGYPF